jgi:hypothetical protein
MLLPTEIVGRSMARAAAFPATRGFDLRRQGERGLQQISRAVFFGGDFGEAVFDVAGGDGVGFAAAVGGGEGEFFADFFDDG